MIDDGLCSPSVSTFRRTSSSMFVMMLVLSSDLVDQLPARLGTPPRPGLGLGVVISEHLVHPLAGGWRRHSACASTVASRLAFAARADIVDIRDLVAHRLARSRPSLESAAILASISSSAAPARRRAPFEAGDAILREGELRAPLFRNHDGGPEPHELIFRGPELRGDVALARPAGSELLQQLVLDDGTTVRLPRRAPAPASTAPPPLRRRTAHGEHSVRRCSWLARIACVCAATNRACTFSIWLLKRREL